MERTILVTGAAGYIGSAICLSLMQQKAVVIALDREKIRHPFFVHSFCADYADVTTLEQIFDNFKIDVVIHCAASIEVGASVVDPLAYYDNNVAKTIVLLQMLHQYSVSKLVFSSSCAVYGTPQYLPLTEDHPHNPVSPYGATKSMIERILADCARAYNFSYVALRYFNAAGALPEYNVGECHEPETHLIPRVLRAAARGEAVTIFGDDYPTHDGSCVRDYVHIADLAQAHVFASTYLLAGGDSIAFNVGTGRGYSVKDIVACVEQVTGNTVATIIKQRRLGDPHTLIADPAHAQKILGWRATQSELSAIIDSAYEFSTQNLCDTTLLQPAARL